jgi:hypothetical protein
MLKVIVDYFSNQWDTILKAPTSLIIVFAFGWSVSSWYLKNRIETNEERLKLKDEQIKEKDTEIQCLKEQLASGEGVYKKSYNLNLTEEEIEALKAISRFERVNPLQTNEFPVEYSVDNLTSDLGINYDEADEIFKKLRRIGFVESIWDNVPTFPDLERPINEARPVRLSRTGQEFIHKFVLSFPKPSI